MHDTNENVPYHYQNKHTSKHFGFTHFVIGVIMNVHLIKPITGEIRNMVYLVVEV